MFQPTKPRVLFILLLFFSIAHAQNKTIDSLKLLLRNPKLHDTTKLYALQYTMSAKYNETNKEYYILNDLAGALAQKKLKEKNPVALRNVYSGYLAVYYATLAGKYSNKRDVANALRCFDKSIELYQLGNYPNDRNYAIIGKGVFYSRINEDEKAIACVFSALKHFETHKFEFADEGIAYCHSTLGGIYAKIGKDTEAIQHYKKSIAFYHTHPNSPMEEHSLSYDYSNCGTSYLRLKKYPEALDNFEKALVLSQKLEDHTTSSVILSKMGMVKLGEMKFDEAEAYLKQALQGDIPEMAISSAYVKMGELYYRKKAYDKADYYLTEGLALAKKNKILELQEQAADLLLKVSKANKNFEKALEMHEFQDMLTDSSKANATRNALAQQQLKYDFEKKEFRYKLDTEKKNAVKNNWLIALSALLLLILLGAYFYYRNARQKQAITVLEKDQIKQKLLITQMNPHFIFNSIENIQGLIHDKQDDAAIDYLNKFSLLTRQILENSNENYISLQEEIDMIKNYLAIQQLLYSNKFDFAIAVDEAMDVETIFLPPMLTQPFIENAIKHGLSNKTHNGLVNIRFYLQNDKLFFEVTDNGKGFDGSKKTSNHKSLAMTITKERLVGYTKNQNFIVHTDNIIGTDENIVGAKVVFEIPYIYEN